jgi:hypothetical protein
MEQEEEEKKNENDEDDNHESDIVDKKISTIHRSFKSRIIF